MMIESEEQAARREGYEAWYDGKRLSDNPFPKGSDCYDSWRAGWLGAEEDH